jgi:integrase
MASILVKLDRRRANAKGNYPVKIVIFNNQTNASISVSFSVPEGAWLKDGLRRPVKASYPGAKMINDRIETFYMEIRKKILELEESGRILRMKAADVKNFVLAEVEAERTEAVTFSSFARRFIDGCRAQKTKQAYEYTLNALRKHFDDFDSLPFEDITLPFLRRFDDCMEKTGMGVNTRSIHFRNIRAIFNRAIDDEIINSTVYPFRKFKIRSEQRDKECLSAAQVRMLHEYRFETEALSMARDYWMLAFFLCGISPVDLFHLKKPDKNGRVAFVRQKMQHETHEVIRLLLQPEAAEIVDRHKAGDGSEYLLSFGSRYVNYDSFKRFVSKKIQNIAKITGLDGLTLYWARYSWATIADGIGIQEKTISKGLGHVDKSMAGRKYIAFDWTKVDRANREVIDFCLELT